MAITSGIRIAVSDVGCKATTELSITKRTVTTLLKQNKKVTKRNVTKLQEESVASFLIFPKVKIPY